MALAFRFLSVAPVVRKLDGRLVARSSVKGLLLNLGARWCRVVVDPREQCVTVHRRLGWVYGHTRHIPFKRILAVTYGYHNESWSHMWSWAHDSFDVFTVGLRVAAQGQRPDDVHLFHFFGEGTFVNDGPLPDWWYWSEYLTDLAGTQDSESRRFVDLLSKMTGAPVDTTSA